MALGGFHPFANVFLGIFQRAQRAADIGCQRAFGAAIAEVGHQRFNHSVAIVNNQGNGAVNQINAALCRHRPFGNMRRFLHIDQTTNICL